MRKINECFIQELFQERDDDESFAGSVVSGGVDLENGNKKTFDGS